MAGSFPGCPMGPAVLVVEDSGFIATKIVQILRHAQYQVVGPVGSPKAAQDRVRSEGDALHAATLDIDLKGEKAFCVAECLQAHWIPFLFLTGYTSLGIPTAWRHIPRLEKPFTAPTLLTAVADLVAGCQPWSGRRTEPGRNGSTEFDQRIADLIRTSRNLIMERSIISECFSWPFAPSREE